MELPGLAYEEYLHVSAYAKQDPRNPPEPRACESEYELASWLKLFGYAARATREGRRYDG